MGTFTKSFGASGGYIAGRKSLIDSLRLRGHSGPYAEAMAPPVLIQVVASMASIMGVTPPPLASPTKSAFSLATPTANGMSLVRSFDDYKHPGMAPFSALPAWLSLPPALSDGSEARERILRLAFNSRYLHAGLKKLGFITYGHPFSPIVPLLVFNPGKLGAFSRMMKERPTPIVVVVVGYPATPLVASRVRFCVSAAHTKDDIDEILRACDEVGDVLDLKHGHGDRWSIEEVTKRSVELVDSF